MEKSDSGEGDNYDSEEDDENEDEEESEEGSEDSDKSGNSTTDSQDEDEFVPGTDDDEYKSESTESSALDLKKNGTSVNTDHHKDYQPKKFVHLRIEDIKFTDSSQNKDVNFSKTTADVSGSADVTTDANTDIDMLASGGNFVARNPERSATGIDFPQYNGEKEMRGGINILSNKIENAGAKESSDIDIPADMNDMEYLDDDNIDEDQFEKENDSNEDMWEKSEDGKNVSDKSKPDDVPEENEDKSSEQIINNDNVSDTNPVDGEMGTSKK